MRLPPTSPWIPPPTQARLSEILSLTRTLAGFPLAGRKVPEFDDESFRELFAYSYRIIYRVDQDAVTVVAVIHGKRML